MRAGALRKSRRPADVEWRSPMPYLIMLVCVSIWGGTWVALKIAEGHGMPPLQFAAMRALPAGVLLAAVALATRAKLTGVREHGWRIAGMTVTTAALFGLGAFGAQRLPGGLSSLLGNSAPLFLVPLGATMLGERVGARAIAGVAIGFLGVAIVASPSIGNSPADLVGVVELLAGTFMLALNTIWSKAAARVDPFVLNAAQMLGAGTALTVVAVAIGQYPAIPMTMAMLLPIGYVSLVATAFAYVLWIVALRGMKASVGGSMMLLVPVFGHLWSRLVLHEPLVPLELLGAAVTLAGIGFTIGAGARRRAGQPAAASFS